MADVGLRIADCGLGIGDWGLRIGDYPEGKPMTRIALKDTHPAPGTQSQRLPFGALRIAGSKWHMACRHMGDQSQRLLYVAHSTQHPALSSQHLKLRIFVCQKIKKNKK